MSRDNNNELKYTVNTDSNQTSEGQNENDIAETSPKTNKSFWLAVMFTSVLIILVCSIIIAMQFTSKDYSKIGYRTPESNTEQSPDHTVQIEDSSEVLIDNPIDFDKLEELNTEIYAWITIPNTSIDYAVVQAGPEHDDFFYLNHNLEGNYEFAGSIYSEKQNALDFSDPVTLIYGHNMLNGTMFADLHMFSDSEFFKKNKYFYIYTKGHKLTYYIYASYIYDNRHILNSFDFSNEEDLKEYFDSTINPISMYRNVRKNFELDLTDKVVTLSTCTKDGSKSTRYLVQGVLKKDERTK